MNQERLIAGSRPSWAVNRLKNLSHQDVLEGLQSLRSVVQAILDRLYLLRGESINVDESLLTKTPEEVIGLLHRASPGLTESRRNTNPQEARLSSRVPNGGQQGPEIRDQIPVEVRAVPVVDPTGNQEET